MSRTNKSRSGCYRRKSGGHTYIRSLFTGAKLEGNRKTRRAVRNTLKAVPSGKDFDEWSLPIKKQEFWNRWHYD
jgi:hypothetical protein